jgi:MoxR-like ATPase
MADSSIIAKAHKQQQIEQSRVFLSLLPCTETDPMAKILKPAKAVKTNPNHKPESIGPKPADLQAKFQDARKAMMSVLVERDDEIDLILTALIAQEHVLLVGPPGCLRGDVAIHDPVDGTTKTVKERWEENKSFHVFALDHNSDVVVITPADAPHKYETAAMIEFTTNAGGKITVTPDHKFWTGVVYLSAREVYSWLSKKRPDKSAVFPLPSTLGIFPPRYYANAQHWTQTVANSMVDHPSDFRSDDVQLHQDEDNGPEVSPLQADCAERNLFYQPRKDDPDDTGVFGPPCPAIPPLSKLGSIHPIESSFEELKEHRPGASVIEPHACSCPGHELYGQYSEVSDTCGSDVEAPCQSTSQLAYCNPPQEKGKYRGTYPIPIVLFGFVSARKVSPEPYYDFCVPIYHNYWACGIFHHNTAKSLVAESVRRWMGGTSLTIQCCPDTTRTVAFGPVKMSALRNDRTERELAGGAAAVDILVLEEVFKAGPAVLNMFLLLMSDRIYREGLVLADAPLKIAIGVSNEWTPEGYEAGLSAFFDRFLFRKPVKPVSKQSGRKQLFRKVVNKESFTPKFKSQLSPDELVQAHQYAFAMPWSNEALTAFWAISEALSNEGIEPSDRRFTKSFLAAQAYAFLQGNDQVQPEDLDILQHVLWVDPVEQPNKARKIIARIANPEKMKIQDLRMQVEDCVEKKSAVEAVTALEQIRKDLEKLRQSPERDRAIAHTQSHTRALLKKVTGMSEL